MKELKINPLMFEIKINVVNIRGKAAVCIATNNRDETNQSAFLYIDSKKAKLIGEWFKEYSEKLGKQ